MRFTNIGFDEDGIISFHINESEQVFYNPFLVALQAMIGEHVMDDYAVQTGSLVPKYIPIRYLYDRKIDLAQEKAKEWLVSSADKKLEAYYWRYGYSVEFGDEELSEGWVSAYAQAYVALAFLRFYHIEAKEQYKNFCLGALSGLVISMEDGGCMNLLSDDMMWFEEIPGKKATHIFNAHIIALIALSEAKEEFGIDKFDRFISCGKRALTELRDYMNTGTMSAYDIPQVFSVQLLLDIPTVANAKVAFGRISMDDGINKYCIDLSSNDCFRVSESYVSGVDWCSELTNDKRRKIVIGASIRNAKVDGGDIQNTFVNYSNISATANTCKLTLEYETNEEVIVKIKKNSINGFIEVGGNKSAVLLPNENKVEIQFRTSELFNDASYSYHLYHIAILTELNRLDKLHWIDRFIEEFRRNLEFQKRNEQLKALEAATPKVESLHVVLNTKDSLITNFCDISHERVDASMIQTFNNDSNEKLDAELLIDRIKTAGDSLGTIHFLSAELTMDCGLEYTVQKLKALGKKVYVTTNGIGLEKTLRDLLESGVDCIEISLDDFQYAHDYMCEKDVFFGSIVAIINENRNLICKRKKDGFRIVASCAISPINYMVLKDLVDPLVKAGFTDLWCTHMNFVTKEVADCHNMIRPGFYIGCSTINAEEDPHLVNPWEMYCSLRATKKKAQEKGMGFVETPGITDYFGYEDLYHRPFTTVGSPVCSAPFRTLQVNADGTLCVMSRCYYLDIGNIKNTFLKDAMMSGAMCDLRKRILSEEQWYPCKRCCAVM